MLRYRAQGARQIAFVHLSVHQTKDSMALLASMPQGSSLLSAYQGQTFSEPQQRQFYP